MDSEHVKSSHSNSENSILDVKAFSNVDIGSAEVHITEVIIKGLPKGDIHITKKKALFIQTFILMDKLLMVAI